MLTQISMATLQEIKDDADATLVTMWSVIQTQQDNYFTGHGVFFGFNWTPPVDVVDGAYVEFGELQAPSRKHVSSDVSFESSELVSCQVQVVRHNGPLGHGYTVWGKIKTSNGDVYYKSKGYGPHSSDTAWYKLEPTI